MTPEEKWKRLSNPKSLADYGLSMTLDEIKQVPECVAEMNSYLPPHKQIKE